MTARARAYFLKSLAAPDRTAYAAPMTDSSKKKKSPAKAKKKAGSSPAAPAWSFVTSAPQSASDKPAFKRLAPDDYIAQVKRCMCQLSDDAIPQDRIAALRWIYNEITRDERLFRGARAEAIDELESEIPSELLEEVTEASDLRAGDPGMLGQYNPKTNEVSHLFAIGVMAYGMENIPFTSLLLNEEQAAGIVEALRKHVLDADSEEARKLVKIHVLDTPMPLTHELLLENNDIELLYLLRDGAQHAQDKCLVKLRPHWPQAAYIDPDSDECRDRYGTRFRMIPVIVTTPRDYGTPTLFKAPSYHGGWEKMASGDFAFMPGAMLKTPFSQDFRRAIASWVGPQQVLHTSLVTIDQALWDLDQHIGVMRVAIALQRMMADYMIDDIDDIVMSFGLFSDDVSEYTECRIAFALKSAPDEVLEGVPMPIPYRTVPDVFHHLRMQVHMMIHSIFGKEIYDPFNDEDEKAYKPMEQFFNLAAEPDSIVRIYFTSTGRQVHVKPFDPNHLPRKNYAFN